MTRAVKIMLGLAAAVVLVPVSLFVALAWSMGEHGRTDLHAAAEQGDEATIRDWIGRGKDLDPEMQFESTLEHSGKKGVTPLMLAARAGATQAAVLLLEAGARVDARSYSPSFPEFGESVLEYAIEGGSPTIVQAVLARLDDRASAQQRDTAMVMALHGVCQDSDYATSGEPKLLAEARLQLARIVIARFAMTDRDLSSLTAWARNADCPGIIDLALEHGVEPMPVMLVTAARSGDVDVVRKLVAKGVDVNARVVRQPAGETTALLAAWEWKRTAVVDALLAAGADPDAPGLDGATLLHALVVKPSAENIEMINRLVAAGARADIPDRNGKTAVQLADGLEQIGGLEFSAQSRRVLQIPQPVFYREVIGGRERRAACQNCPVESPPAQK